MGIHRPARETVTAIIASPDRIVSARQVHGFQHEPFLRRRKTDRTMIFLIKRGRHEFGQRRCRFASMSNNRAKHALCIAEMKQKPKASPVIAGI